MPSRKFGGTSPWLPPAQDIVAYAEAFRAGDRETMQRLDPGSFEPHADRDYKFPG